MSVIKKIFEQIAQEPEQSHERRKELLENLKTALASIPRAETVAAIVGISLETLFECLGSDYEVEIDITCGILKNLMTVLEPTSVLTQYHDSILQGFQHPNGSVRALVIAQLQRCVDSSPESVSLLCNEYQDLIIASINQLASDDLESSKVAGLLLINLTNHEVGSNFVLGSAGIGSIKNILNSPRTSDTIKFRVYETLSLLAKVSEEHLQIIEKNHLLIQPLSEITFNSSDPLGQMNALEILSIVVESKHGLEAVERAGIFGKLKRFSENWKVNPMGSLVFPGVLKFIGKIGVTQMPPEDLAEMVTETLLENEKDFALSTVAVEALSYISSTQDGKVYLNQYQGLGKCFEKIQRLLVEAPSEFRCRVMDALAILFGSDELATQDYLPRWFSQVFPKISVLFSLVQQPFPDIRLSSLHFLNAIAHIEWAQKQYLRIPGVVEFLLDRNLEPNKDCALAKFNIVRVIAESSTSQKILPETEIGRLKIHVSQGPFYAEAQVSLATEGAD